MNRILSSLISFALLFSFVFATEAKAAPTDVHMVADELWINGTRVFAPISTVNPSDTVIWKVAFGGGSNDQTVLIDLEIKDSATHNRVAQLYWDNEFFAAGQTKTYTIQMPTGLPPSVAPFYGFSAGVFNPNWQGNLHWYYTQQAVAVTIDPNNPPPGDVIYDHATFSSSVAAGQSNTFTVYLKGLNQTKTVLLDLELKDIDYNKYGQIFWDNVIVAPGETPSFVWNTPTTLKPGTYYLAVGIFEPGWNGLMHWYKYQETFTVTAGTPTPEVYLSSSSQASASLSEGESNTLTANITNTGSTAFPVLVDLEVYDQNNNKIAQSFTDDFPAIGTRTFTLTTPALSLGNYRFAVGIFNPGWAGQPIHWYNSEQVFTVQ